ncbi:lipase [Aspergillus nomiae NRRL 13137]|uniref:Lipase n=1 Tax=Aspergillus nomiae NRRL (strain ATCC 15546 / NRRL 13137 / CBS 260.88 / M93) TaxID=1509407 RepID=A0A0L1J584_ASPN3|nr:lipase [Aspergillus nomiae NRRL 13137]KNG86904.1 lipase [Aspergillus nomiae NRRL 13137]
MASSRWWLLVQAVFWRFLMRIGMFIHHISFPRPPRRSFVRSIPSGSSRIDLYFYCPPEYSQDIKEGRRFPVVVNFHGGGFTLGCPTDDSRWAQSVLAEVGAVMVSVGYRRAPEHPFPAAVDDGVRAIQYLSAHAIELGLDVSRIALSGFSAGGNLAVTLVDASASDVHIVAIFCWYPILDFEESRELRRNASIMPDKTLPEFFTNLFDEAYLPDLVDRRSPYASPVRAADDLLADALPHDIFLYICEWDMLLNEGQQFVRRLQDIGKHVRAMMIEKVPHAWDKSPNPWRDQEQVDILYRDACADMKAIFNA